MVFVNATTLTEIIGTVEELKTVGYIVYSPKLNKTIMITDEMYQELDKEEVQNHQHNKKLKQSFHEFLNELGIKRQEDNNQLR